MEKITNTMIIILLAFELGLSAIGASIGTWWEVTYGPGSWYLGVALSGRTPGYIWIETFCGYVVVFNSIVPIAMYVSMEIVRVIQAKSINWDQDLSYNGVLTMCRNSNLNEELGQVRTCCIF
jgi:phospholipid-translocating ATPase